MTAGIGVLGQASPMIQEMFPGAVTAAAAAGFVGLLSLFNKAVRFAWSSLSDAVGRKATYAVFFGLGAGLYALVPLTGRLGSVGLFVAAYAVIMSMYGGGFATIPAYLRDQFGTARVGAIHGRLLTAWSPAGVAGPVLVNYLRAYQIEGGVPKAEAYTFTMYLMAGLFLVRRPAGRREPEATGDEIQPGRGPPGGPTPGGVGRSWPAPAFRWAWVGLPLAWGVWHTAVKSLDLFG